MDSSTAVRSTRRTGTVNRRDAQREATRARLFEESVEEFKRNGVVGSEIAVITDRAGVSRGAFYVHYASKDEVLRELLLAEEHRIVEDIRPLIDAQQSLAVVLRAIGDSVLRAERRLGRRLIRDLCAAQFRPEFADDHDVDSHPLGLVLVAAVLDRHPGVDAADVATVFLTGLFGLLATADGPQAQRRHLIDVLVELLTKGITT